MIVEVVTCQIGEYPTAEFQSADSALLYCMRRTLHERILTSGIDHACEEPIQFYGVRRCVVCRYSLILNIVAYCRQQTALMSHLTEHIIQQCRYRCLSVGARHAH